MSCPNPDCPDARELTILRLVLAAVFDVWTTPSAGVEGPSAKVMRSISNRQANLMKSIETGVTIFRELGPEVLGELVKAERDRAARKADA